MGGYGSGRWGWHRKKTTVEECWSLGADWLIREKLLVPGAVMYSGRLAWHNTRTQEEVGSVGYSYDTTDMERSWLRLVYTVNKAEHFDYTIWLTTTPVHFGGVRWWFICPLTKSGIPCRRRVGKLYLPPDGKYFGCRHCYDLTYTSSQKHDPRISRLRLMDPDMLLAAIRGGEVDLVLGLKALWGEP